MLRERSMTILTAVTFILGFAFMGQSARADWGVSFYGEVGSPYYTYQGDRITSQYRRGYQADDWVERGASSVTESPMFSDGIRLTAWTTQYEEDYEYALASAIYFFEIPPSSRSIRIKISYDGEADRDDFSDEIAGRVWIRRARIGDDYEEYYPKEGRYEDVDQPLYGDTFVLRARKHLEIIRISAEDHVVDDMMELHVVAEGRQRIDVKYIEVETYTALPSVRVITRYYGDYVWRPWYDYTYWYFYTGPTYHFSDYYYVRYTYPGYGYHYVEIRRRYNDYLHVYYIGRPYYHVRWIDVAHVHKGVRRTWDRDRLGKWTSDHEEARRSYGIVSMKTRRPVDVQVSRERIRSVLADHSRSSSAKSRASTDASKERREAVQTRSSSVTEMKTRSKASEPRIEKQRSSSSSLRVETDRSRSPENPPARIETRSDTKTRRDDTKSSIRTRSSSSSRTGQERIVRQSPTKSSENVERVKIRRESSESRTRENVKREPVKSEPRKQAPPKKEEVKKNDKDDDDDKDKEKKSSTTRSSVKKRRG